MVNVNQDLQLQWRVTLEDGEVLNWRRFQDAWAYAMPDADEGWIYLPKVTAVNRFVAGEKKICVAWKPQKQIFIEWF
jgi:hypothetical protein